MKSFLRFALRGLILLVVALVSAVTAMRFAIHGHEVAVPNLVGKTPSEARHISEDAGLDLMMERQYYSDSVPEGRILSQLPVPGTRVRQGWQVRVAESLGKQRVDIPSVLGESERAAEMNIQRRGLDVSSVAQLPLSGATGDNVVAQNPVPAASGVSSPNIGLLIAQPAPPAAYVMPSFVGQTLGNASVAILDAGWHSSNITASAAAATPPAPSEDATTPPPAPVPPPLPTSASTIVSQTPAAGAKAVVGSPIAFTVR
jgi:beta-lactam-binding protein with PASTA domain